MSKFSTRDLSVSIKNDTIDKTYINLNISVEILKTLSGIPNTAEIQIWNLNQNSREDLYNNVYDFEKNNAKTSITISLDDETIFTGQLINVNSIQNQSEAEWTTTLYCADSFNAYRKKITKKYEKGATRKEIVDDLLSELEEAGLATKGLIDDIAGCTDKSILKSIVVNGEIMKNVKKLLSTCLGGGSDKADVYIDDGKVNVTAKNNIIENNIVINAGLFEPPTLTEQGINCKTLLNSSLKIGAKFEVQSKSSNIAYGNLTKYRIQKNRISGTGVYKTLELRHKVDNFSADVASTEIIGLNQLRARNAS